MLEDAEPVVVYEGSDDEVLFLQGLLKASGISCSTYSPIRGRASGAPRLFVARADVERAMPLIDDFRKQGTKTQY